MGAQDTGRAVAAQRLRSRNSVTRVTRQRWPRAWLGIRGRFSVCDVKKPDEVNQVSEVRMNTQLKRAVFAISAIAMLALPMLATDARKRAAPAPAPAQQ